MKNWIHRKGAFSLSLDFGTASILMITRVLPASLAVNNCQ